MIRFLPEALDDLIETQRWYAQRDQDMGPVFAAAIASAVDRIAQDPAALPCVHGSVRRLVVRPGFRLLSTSGRRVDEVLVLAIHGSQAPRRWQDRS